MPGRGRTPRRRLPNSIRESIGCGSVRSQRAYGDRGLHDRLRIRHALAEASGLLVSGDRADINAVLGILGRAVRANRAYIFLFRDNYRYMDNTHEWCAPGIQPEIDNLQDCSTEIASWWMEHIKANRSIVIPDVAAMPSEAAEEQQVLQMQDIRSLLVVPMYSGDQAIGYLGFDDTSGPREWSQEEEYLLRAASDLITGYFERCNALHALKESEARYRELTDLLPQAVFEMNLEGLLTFVNQYALDAFGYTYEEFLQGVNVLQTIIPEHRELGKQNIMRLLNGEHFPNGNEYTALRKDGSTFPVIIYSDKIIRNGVVVGIRGVIADISEQKRVEEELRTRTRELEAVVSAFPDIYFWLDSSGTILHYHTLATGELYVKPEHFLGCRFRDVLPSDVARKLEDAIAEASQLRTLISVEYQLPVHGDEHYYEARITPLHDNQVLAIVRDITSRKCAEEALRESEQRFRSVFNSSLDGLVIFSDEAIIMDANPAACELAGLPKDRVVGRGLQDFIQIQGDPGALWESFLRDGLQRGQTAFITADGATRDVEYHAVANALPGYHFASLSDITDLKRAEAEMLLQACAINAASNQIAITDPDGIIEFVNPAYSCNCKDCPDEKVGSRLCVADRHPDIWSIVSRGSVWHGEITDRDRDDQVFIEDATITPVCNDEGEIEHFVVIKRDITDRRMAERRYESLVSSIPGIVYRVSLYREPAVEFISRDTTELLGWSSEEVTDMSIGDFIELVEPEDRKLVKDTFFSANTGDSYQMQLRMRSRDGSIQHLETMGRIHRGFDGKLETAEGIVFNITERVREQEQLNQARRMETVGKLAAGIAHDFNNLMQGILGYTRVLSENSSLNDAARLDLIEIERVSLRAADLVRQILAFSRQAPARMEPVDMTGVISETIQLLKTTFPRNIDIVTVIPARMAQVMADSSQIHEVLVNLGLNARDAMPDGGKLTVSLEQIALSEKFAGCNPWARSGQFIRCVVTDNGHGMDDDTLKRAFDPFFTTKPVHKGTGLGLSICYGIIESHNGFMNIESVLNGGTSVSVYIPVTETVTKPESVDEVPSCLRGSETVLVVDDEEYIRRLTDRLLSSFGYNVLLAENGAQAIDTVVSSDASVDVVLLDLNMPEMNGANTLASIRDILPDLKVLVLSGMDTELENSPSTVCPDGVLQKPCQPEVLLKKIREVLDR